MTADGEADIYGLGDYDQGLMINHASGRQIWQLIVDVEFAEPLAMPSCPWAVQCASWTR